MTNPNEKRDVPGAFGREMQTEHPMSAVMEAIMQARMVKPQPSRGAKRGVRGHHKQIAKASKDAKKRAASGRFVW